VAAHRDDLGAARGQELDEMARHVVGVGSRDRNPANAEMTQRVDEGDGGRRRGHARRGGHGRRLVASALRAEHEAARRTCPHDGVGFLVCQRRRSVGEPFATAQIQQGVDAVSVLTDRRDRHRQTHRPADARLERRKIVCGAVAGIEQAHRWHVISLGSCGAR
jgi:hypothetical protein